MKWFRRNELQPVWSDEPRMLERYREIWDRSPVLRRFYHDLWAWVMADFEGLAPLVELGSGAGLIREVYPEVRTTDILPSPWTNLVCDGSRLPFAEGSLGGALCVAFFHHCVNPGRLFEEIQRVLRPGGKFVIVDPFVSPIGRIVYHFGTEESIDLGEPPFEAEARTSAQPLLEANVARATIVFMRQRAAFESRFPGLRIENVEPINLFRHVAAGSCVQKSPFPNWCYPVAALADRVLHPFRTLTGMCMKVVLAKD